VLADKSTLHGNLEHLNRILPNRTLRSLARYGVAGDKTGMGSKSKGVVLVDEHDIEYVEDRVDPSSEQISRFLQVERRRIFNAPGLQKSEAHTETEGEDLQDEEDAFEEADYKRAMQKLAILQEPLGVIAFCFVMTGTGSSVFFSPNLEKREKALTLLRGLLAKAISVSSAEISVGKIQDTTSSTLNECCDIEVADSVCAPRHYASMLTSYALPDFT
jgi:hypothetical protein